MKYKQLGETNIKASEIGLGASVFSNFYKDSDFVNNSDSLERVKKVIKCAFEAGINYYDVAPWYGVAEILLSEALSEYPRSSYYLATKVGRYNSDKGPTEWFDFSYKRTIESVENSLKLFKTDFIDLMQVHDFEFAPDLSQIVNETLPALNEFRAKGKIKYIGINSYSLEKIKELLEISPVKIDTVLSFSHLSLDDTSYLDFMEYFRSKKVGCINASPLSMGQLTPIGPPDWHRAPLNVKAAGRAAYEFCKSNNVSLPKLALNFSLNQHADLTIVSMSSEKILQDNIESLAELSEHEKKILNQIRDKFFIPLKYKGYGDVDVQKYRLNITK